MAYVIKQGNGNMPILLVSQIKSLEIFSEDFGDANGILFVDFMVSGTFRDGEGCIKNVMAYYKRGKEGSKIDKTMVMMKSVENLRRMC